MKSAVPSTIPLSFDRLSAELRVELDAMLRPWLAARVEHARQSGQAVEVMADAVRQLALRGGKRLRAILLSCAFDACGGEGGFQAVAAAAMGVELLQTYLLIHDDWMDDDEVRRGGPSVPAVMRARFPEHADEASVLAGDLAAAWARSAFMELTLAPSRVLEAARELARVEQSVVEGQWLDVCGVAGDPISVEATLALKTSSYTTSGPVVIGAILAGADEETALALHDFANPLGVAFQLRDDLLGLFGDATTTGKTAGSDVRKGKRTSVILDAMRDPSAAAVLSRVMGRADASDSDLAHAFRMIDESGARGRCESRIATLVDQSLTALARARVTPAGRSLLVDATTALTQRGA